MTKLIRALSVVSLIGVALTQGGCLLVAAAAGTGATVAYVRGDSEVTLAAAPDRVADAAEQAMKDLQVAVVSKSAGQLDAKVVGRTARDTKLQVVAKAEGSASRVSVRAGTFGDSALQAQLMEKIRANLGLAAPAAPAAVAAAAAAAPSTQPSATAAKPAASPATQPAVADVK